ncbi:hypothetical protein F4810DRAFT_723482 [Camillea tinctor]|nr:hypothetical protein F4810DRAFT_723482 [Camillea tinctor]
MCWTYLYHPISLVLRLYAHLGLCIILVPPAHLPRLISLLSLLAHANHAHKHVAIDLPLAGALYTDCRFVGIHVVLFASYHLCLARTSPPPGCTAFAQKAAWAVKHVLSSPRADLREKPAFASRDPAYVPSRGSFMASHVRRAVVFFLARKAFRVVQGRLYYGNLVDGDYDQEKESVIRRAFSGTVQSREIWIRAWLPLNFFVDDYVSKNLIYSSLALLAVAIFQDDHTRWPPLYGSIGEAYTLRRVWGVWRHQMLRVAYVAHAKFIAISVLRIRSQALRRIVITLFTFAIAGFVHTIASRDSSLGAKLQLSLWLSIAVGIILEDCAMAILRIVVPSSMNKRPWTYAIGYVWVYLFYWWYLPKYYFPWAEYYEFT